MCVCVRVCARAYSFTGTLDRFNARASSGALKLDAVERERERVLFLKLIFCWKEQINRKDGFG